MSNNHSPSTAQTADSLTNLSRRSTLAALGMASLGAVPGHAAGSNTARPDGTGLFPFDRSGSGFAFDHVYNVVDDLGADPTGEERIDDILSEYVQDNTKLIFPAGTYKLGQFRNNTGDLNDFAPDQYYFLENVWFKGQGSDKTILRPPDGWGTPTETHDPPWGTLFWEIRYSNNIRFEGFQIDYSHPDTGSRFQIYPENGLFVRDVYQHGITSNDETSFAFAVDDPDGYGLIQNLRAPHGIDPAITSPSVSGPTGMYIPDRHQGTLELRNCSLVGFGDNGLYGSSPGPEARLIVNGGYYANNNISNIRVGQSDSVVMNATVVVDDPIETNYTANHRGIRQQDGEGTLVRNCDVIYTADAPASACIISETRGGAMTVENCRIHVGDPATTEAIAARSPEEETADDDPILTEAMTIRNVQITGDAATGDAIRIVDRDDNVIENVCIEQPGDERDGIDLLRSDTVLRNAAIEVGGEAIVTEDSDLETHNVRDRANCTTPRFE